MPPALDIYALTKHRDRPTIERFLDEYVDRPLCEDRGDEDLMILRLGRTNTSGSAESDWESEPAVTLSHSVNRGLDYPRRAFTIYLRSKIETIDRVYLRFTTDNQMVVGLSVEDEGKRPQNEKYARGLLDRLIREFDASIGLIIVESPPPMNEAEFVGQKTAPLVTYFWERASASTNT